MRLCDFGLFKAIKRNNKRYFTTDCCDFTIDQYRKPKGIRFLQFRDGTLVTIVVSNANQVRRPQSVVYIDHFRVLTRGCSIVGLYKLERLPVSALKTRREPQRIASLRPNRIPRKKTPEIDHVQHVRKILTIHLKAHR